MSIKDLFHKNVNKFKSNAPSVASASIDVESKEKNALAQVRGGSTKDPKDPNHFGHFPIGCHDFDFWLHTARWRRLSRPDAVCPAG